MSSVIAVPEMIRSSDLPLDMGILVYLCQLVLIPRIVIYTPTFGFRSRGEDFVMIDH